MQSPADGTAQMTANSLTACKHTPKPWQYALCVMQHKSSSSCLQWFATSSLVSTKRVVCVKWLNLHGCAGTQAFLPVIFSTLVDAYATEKPNNPGPLLSWHQLLPARPKLDSVSCMRRNWAGLIGLCLLLISWQGSRYILSKHSCLQNMR